ncbi:unnamed protein product [Rhizoctonia solani]|uniref:Glucose-methanol-choline oxidoreductase N-terminal domain-containing protein n=1 Tax=Rhizoctonia solani TaxID=456999 RepID=A0A8H3HT53_9AGAM|nr:unnamed protein product [Rhizoctonia solani]
MVFDRASKVEYDAWAKLGNPGWDWEGLLGYMRTAERFTCSDPFRVNHTNVGPNSLLPSQGRHGPIAASYNSWYGDITLPFWRSLVNLGVPTNFDPDSGDAFGIFNTASSVNRTTGRRSYSASTYYAYNAHRPNFVVLTEARATKINFKNTTNNKRDGNLVASGVSFVHKSQSYTVKAKKEVILSAGAFQSPHLLELSGIGNPRILWKHGIKPLIDLPGVGENYQDHLLLTIAYELKPGSSTQGFDDLRNNATFAAAAAAQYNATHDGILSYPAGSILSFFNLDFVANPAEISSLITQLDREIASENTSLLQDASYDIQKGWLRKKVGWVEVAMYPGYLGASAPKSNTSYITVFLFMEHPFSRGNIHINTSDPLVAPQIDPKYFSKSIDLETLVHLVRFVQKLSETQPLASAIATQQEMALEGSSDAAIVDYIKTHVVSSHHPIGSVALAPKELGGVVDVHLMVHGTTNLRVVDASIIPLHIGTHIQRTVYGIAEKVAKMIINQEDL